MKKRYRIIALVLIIIAIVLGVCLSNKKVDSQEEPFNGNTKWTITQYGDNSRTADDVVYDRRK